ncbi:MAG: PEP-CTERM sorting domain-containing protein [Telluria sp.]
MKLAIKIASILFAAWTGLAQAAVIDFEDVPEDEILVEAISGGFRFVVNNDGALYITDGAACSPPCASNGTRNLVAGGVMLDPFLLGNVVTVTREAGGEFLFSGFDAAELFQAPDTSDAALLINLSALLGGSEVLNLNFTLDQLLDGPGGINDFQTFAFAGINVDTLVFTGINGISGSNGFTLDNLVVTIDDGGPGPTPVPEPGSLALGALGAASMLMGRRRRAVK